MRVLLTGGAGYIASHTAVCLIERGHEAIALDNFANSSPESVRRVRELTGGALPLIEGDATDPAVLARVFEEHRPDAVIHFAGLKSVSESVREPLNYYRVNLGSTLAVLEAMAEAGIHKIVFSSSATVYEQPGSDLVESDPVGTNLENPYGRTKAMGEWILRDAAAANPALEVGILRYFNPVGAHSSGRIGEDPVGIPNNLLPYIAQVATGTRERLRVFGNDYPTVDGTGIRDYIHVMDLAEAHVAALEHLTPGVFTTNIGTGRGTSVLEALRAFEQAVGHELPYEIVERRPGDAAIATANPALAAERLDWRAKRTFEEACSDAWNWQRQNPRGYEA